jgi:hypothetical protein
LTDRGWAHHQQTPWHCPQSRLQDTALRWLQDNVRKAGRWLAPAIFLVRCASFLQPRAGLATTVKLAMINTPLAPALRTRPAGRSISASSHDAPACPYCRRRLELREAPLRTPAGFRLEQLHGDSGPRDLSRFGLCGRCRVVFEDVNALIAMYGQLREQILLAVRRARRARERFDAGRGDVRAALSELAEAFVCLQGQPGVRPFSPSRLNGWMCGTALGADQRECAAFVLHVTDAASPWGQRFDVVAAMECWNPPQHAAFIEWAQAPWWAGS